MRIIAVFTLFLLLVTPSAAHPQAFGGVGTRAQGMGGAFVAVADDASAVYWNPAGIATGATFDLQVAKGDSNIFVGAALPVLGVSYYRTRELADLPTVSASPDRQMGGSGDVQIRTLTMTNFGVTVVQTVVPGVVAGTTVRSVRGRLDGGEGRTTVDLDAGVLVSTGPLRFGLAARNLRAPAFETGGGRIHLERQFRAGAAYAPRALPQGVHGPFSVAFDVELTAIPGARGDRRMAAAGGEYWLAQGLIGVRAGVQWNTVGEATPGITGGATVRLPRSVFVESHITKQKESDENEWTVGGRVTF